jgi:L-fucose isomerase-like protein
MTVTLIPFFSPLAVDEWVAGILERLAATEAKVTDSDDFLRKVRKGHRTAPTDHTLIFVGTGGTEKAIADFLVRAPLQSPILLLSHDGNNSLPAAMETRTYLEERGTRARVVHAPLDRLIERIREWCSYGRIEDRIRSSRIGLIGKPSSWLVASRVNPAKVHKRWGLTIEKYPITALLNHLEEQVQPDFALSLEQFVKQAAKTKVPQEELIQAGTVAQALTRFIRTHKLDAVTVECFTLLQQTGIAGCYALSRVNDLDSVVAGCEGDVPTTFTLLVAKLLTERPAFMANVTDVDLDSNSVVFAHCTVATSMVDAYEITTHFESGKSVAIQGRLRPQPVTVLKVLGEDLSRYWVSSGVVIPHQTTANGCRTQVRVKLTEPVSYFLEESLANHHVIVPGNYAKILCEFFAFVLGQ